MISLHFTSYLCNRGIVIVLLMLKSWPFYTGAELSRRDRVLGEIEKNSRAVLLCQKKEDAVDSCALRSVYPNPGGFDEEFYNNDSKVGTR